MLTGLYPPSHGSLCNGVPISEGVTTMPELLRRHGFVAGAFVSGVTLKAKNCGLGRGFDIYDDRFEGFSRRAIKTLNRSLHWLRQQRTDQDIFLFFHLYDPHFDYNPPKTFARFGLDSDQPAVSPLKREELMASLRVHGRTDRITRSLNEWIRRYDAEIAYSDWATGELLRNLKILRRYDDALIFMVSDHGETLDERPWIFDHGARVNEEQIRIPMIMKLPNQAFSGRKIAFPVSHIDILPTILASTGLLQEEQLPGLDLHKVIVDEDLPRTDRTLFTMARRVPKRMTDLDFKIPKPGKSGRPGSQILAIRRYPYKLIDFGLASPRSLLVFYDLAKDPEETKPVLVSQHSMDPIQAELHRQLNDWWHENWRPDNVSTIEIPEETVDVLRALGYVE